MYQSMEGVSRRISAVKLLTNPNQTFTPKSPIRIKKRTVLGSVISSLIAFRDSSVAFFSSFVFNRLGKAYF